MESNIKGVERLLDQATSALTQARERGEGTKGRDEALRKLAVALADAGVLARDLLKANGIDSGEGLERPTEAGSILSMKHT